MGFDRGWVVEVLATVYVGSAVLSVVVRVRRGEGSSVVPYTISVQSRSVACPKPKHQQISKSLHYKKNTGDVDIKGEYFI